MRRTERLGTRRLRRSVVTAALLALPLALAGCGGGDDAAEVTPGAAPSTSTTPGEGGGMADTELTIVVDPGDGASPTTWTLTCDPAGGTHPDAAKACEVLAARGEEALPPVAEDAVCSQMIGGSQTARITGTWRGKDVASEFSQINGCEIGRWSALEGLLPPKN